MFCIKILRKFHFDAKRKMQIFISRRYPFIYFFPVLAAMFIVFFFLLFLSVSVSHSTIHYDLTRRQNNERMRSRRTEFFVPSISSALAKVFFFFFILYLLFHLLIRGVCVSFCAANPLIPYIHCARRVFHCVHHRLNTVYIYELSNRHY